MDFFISCKVALNAARDVVKAKLSEAIAAQIAKILISVPFPLNVGIAAGAGIGKAVSDGAQFIFGGGKSAEQRRMEEALAALRGGQF